MFIALITTGARNAFGVFVIPMEEEFGWNRTTVTAAGFVGAVVAGVIQPFLGRIFDATGGRKVVLMGLIGVGVTMVLLSLTFHIIFLIVMFGVLASVAAGGVSINNTGAMMARWFRRRRATVLGFIAAGASLGGMVMVPFAMFLLQATNWRLTWVALGVLVLSLAVPLAYFFIRESPSTMGCSPTATRNPLTPLLLAPPNVVPDRWRPTGGRNRSAVGPSGKCRSPTWSVAQPPTCYRSTSFLTLSTVACLPVWPPQSWESCWG